MKLPDIGPSLKWNAPQHPAGEHELDRDRGVRLTHHPPGHVNRRRVGSAAGRRAVDRAPPEARDVQLCEPDIQDLNDRHASWLTVGLGCVRPLICRTHGEPGRRVESSLASWSNSENNIVEAS